MRVQSIPSSGYVWQVPQLPAGLELLGSDYDRPAAAVPGGLLIHVFRFRAARPGSYPITFVRKREWETTPLETETVIVTVP